MARGSSKGRRAGPTAWVAALLLLPAAALVLLCNLLAQHHDVGAEVAQAGVDGYRLLEGRQRAGVVAHRRAALHPAGTVCGGCRGWGGGGL